MQHEHAKKYNKKSAETPARFNVLVSSPEIPSWAELRKQTDADFLGEKAVALALDRSYSALEIVESHEQSPDDNEMPRAVKELQNVGENMSDDDITRDTGADYRYVDSPEGQQDALWHEEMGEIKDQIWSELEELYFSIKLAAANDDATPESLSAIANSAPTVTKYTPYPEKIAAAAIGSDSQGEYMQKLWGFADVVRARVAAYTAKPDLNGFNLAA